MADHLQGSDAVRVVRIDRPERRNAIDSDTAERLYQEFTAFDADPGVVAAIEQAWDRLDHVFALARRDTLLNHPATTAPSAPGPTSPRSPACARAARSAPPGSPSPSR